MRITRPETKLVYRTSAGKPQVQRPKGDAMRADSRPYVMIFFLFNLLAVNRIINAL